MNRLVYIVMLCLALCSCRVVREGQSSHHSDSETNTETAVKIERIIDSVYIDKWHTIYQKGDTVFKIDSILVDRWKSYTLHDTLMVADTVRIENVDTLFRVEEVVPERYKKGMKAAIVEGIIIALMIAAGGVYLYFRLRK